LLQITITFIAYVIFIYQGAKWHRNNYLNLLP
jgi:cbb3-type cytochrome oxidase subunit 3